MGSFFLCKTTMIKLLIIILIILDAVAFNARVIKGEVVSEDWFPFGALVRWITDKLNKR